jgi:hypothetical protein
MRGLLRFILLKAIWLAVIAPTVFIVSGLLAFLIARGISRLLGKDMDELGACFVVPIAVPLALFAVGLTARALRRFDERKTARGRLEAQPQRESGAGEMSQSYGRERL